MDCPPDQELHLAAFGTPRIRRGHIGNFNWPETYARVTHNRSNGIGERDMQNNMVLDKSDLGALDCLTQLPQICMTCLHMHGNNKITHFNIEF